MEIIVKRIVSVYSCTKSLQSFLSSEFAFNPFPDKDVCRIDILTLYHTILTFNNHETENFLKHSRRKKCW